MAYVGFDSQDERIVFVAVEVRDLHCHLAARFRGAEPVYPIDHAH
jgi:hypothetical protein